MAPGTDIETNTPAVVHKKCTYRSATSQAATLALFTRPACRAAAVAGRAARTLKGFLSLVSGGRVLASHWPRLERVTGCQPITERHKKLGQRGADADCWSRRGKCPPHFPGSNKHETILFPAAACTQSIFWKYEKLNNHLYLVWLCFGEWSQLHAMHSAQPVDIHFSFAVDDKNMSYSFY